MHYFYLKLYNFLKKTNIRLSTKENSMKKSGIIRRLDDLGRIVIPKEIRKTLHIKEGTPLDINVEDEQTIVLRKFSPIMELGNMAKICAEVLYDAIGEHVYITDLEKIVALGGTKTAEHILRENIIKLVNKRSVTQLDSYNDTLFIDEATIHKNIIIAPIIVEGDVLGSIIVDYKEYSDIMLESTKLASNFVSKLAY